MCDLAQVYACNESMLSQRTEGNGFMRIPILPDGPVWKT